MGGHGATDNEKQIYLLNEAEAKNAQYAIEFKLRYLTNDELSLTRVFAVFDCCRVPIMNLKGLSNTKRGNGADIEKLDTESDQDEEPCKYF